jgi:hypothetical protein
MMIIFNCIIAEKQRFGTDRIIKQFMLIGNQTSKEGDKKLRVQSREKQFNIKQTNQQEDFSIYT